jgi:predicted amidohydrolase
MKTVTIAVVQQRMSIPPTHDEFVAEARRFLRQARAKSVQLTVFPELTGVMLAPPLISGFKRSFIQREDQGKHPTAGILSRSMGRLAGATGGTLGGGFRGSLERLLRKRSHELRDAYMEIFGQLAREFSTAIIAGSLYVYDEEDDAIRNRSYVFDVAGEVVGYQDKLNLAGGEHDLATPGSAVNVLDTRYGRLGILIGLDALYPEVSRLLAIQGADMLIGVAASPGAASARTIRSALALRAEENQVFAACSFLLGPNHLGRENREDFCGQSALLAPISLTQKGDGILVQAGTDRTEGIIADDLSLEDLYTLRQTSRFRPRQEMHLGGLGPVLADFYQQGLTIEEAVQREHPTAEETPIFEPVSLKPELPEEEPREEEAEEKPVELSESVPEEVGSEAPEGEVSEAPEPEAESRYPSVAEVLSLTGSDEPEE